MEAVKEKQKEFSVLILTPYLSQNLMEMPGIEEQIERYKYNPDNFNGLEFVMTEEGSKVNLKSPPYESVNRRAFLDAPLPPGITMPTLAIAGSTEPGEEEVGSLRGTGMIVGRYSIFYRGKSQYTGNSPEESGYALDIPKDMQAVRALLTSESVMDALESRDSYKIRESLERINETLNKPILATPYLEEALS